MIDFDDLKALVRTNRSTQMEMLIPIITTLISGLIIILSISPQYLLELNPFTLLLLSIASALPVWALNQLLWLHLERRMTSQVVARIVMAFDVSVKEKKVLSFALSRIMKPIDIMRFIPSRDIANFVTILTIYLGGVIVYFSSTSSVVLYLSIFSLSFAVWLICLCLLHNYCNKIDVRPIKKVWEQFINNEELFGQVNSLFERIEKLVRARTDQETNGNDTEDKTNGSQTPGQNPE